LQGLPGKHSRSGGDTARILDCCEVSTLRRAPALPPDGDFSGQGVFSVIQKTGAFRAWRDTIAMFDPNANMPRINRNMVYLGACLIAGIRLAREKQVNVRVVPTIDAIEESVDLAQDIFIRVFSRAAQRIVAKEGK
jgi:hypothetical protein